MKSQRFTDFSAVGLADVVIPCEGSEYTKYAEKEDEYSYTMAMISAILKTDKWDFGQLTDGSDELIFYGTEECGRPVNTVAEEYVGDDLKGKPKHLYGDVFVVNHEHVDIRELIKAPCCLEWRELVLKLTSDVYIKRGEDLREIAPANGAEEYSLKELQEMVGGYIEVVNVDDDHSLIVDEEGMLKLKDCEEFPLNMNASIIAQQIIVGNAVLLHKKHLK